MQPIIPKALEDYCAAHSMPASPLRNEIEVYTTQHRSDAQMLTGSLETALLQMLIRLTGARVVIEIGLYTGYSALALAEALPADGMVISCEIDSENARTAQSFFDRRAAGTGDHGGKIRIELGPALETLARLPTDPPFDFAFLDADKENYLNYYEALLPRIRPGGLIVADNVLWSGRVLTPKTETDRAIVRFNEHVRADTRVECVMLPVRDGVSLIRKRLFHT